VTDSPSAGGRGVFVFASNDVTFYRTVTEASGYLERVDVDNGEYAGFFTVDGERLTALPIDEASVSLEPTGMVEPEELMSLLRRAHGHHVFTSDPGNPQAVAQEMLTWQWRHRWPRWPRWLGRRLHGDRPPRI
jgi:hypothetical protein